MQLFIKYLGIIICCIYFYIKLLHISFQKSIMTFIILFSILLTVISIYVESFFPYASLPFLFLLLFIILSYPAKTELSVSFTTSVISFTLSYALFTITSSIISAIALLFPQNIDHLFFQLLSCILQLLLMPLPFQFKRTKNGMPFLKKQYYAIPGMLLGIAMLFASILLNTNDYKKIYLIPYIFVFIFCILIYLYWKNNLTKSYIDRIHIKNLEDLNKELLKNQQYIKSLERDNQQLAKIIHRDNKLIPAMIYSVKEYMNIEHLDTSNQEIGRNLLIELEKLWNNRQGVILQQDMYCEKICPCNVTSIDNLLNYMQQKAINSNIHFHITLQYDIRQLINNTIDESSLNTLLADLIENAIIATKHNNGNHILLNIGMVSNNWSIHIFDSGLPFDKEVLVKLGQEPITTHSDDSGSGIGLMEIYKIVRLYKASLYIDEFSLNSGLYNKKISIIFNRQSQYVLYTSRNRDEIAYLSRRNTLTVYQK